MRIKEKLNKVELKNFFLLRECKITTGDGKSRLRPTTGTDWLLCIWLSTVFTLVDTHHQKFWQTMKYKKWRLCFSDYENQKKNKFDDAYCLYNFYPTKNSKIVSLNMLNYPYDIKNNDKKKKRLIMVYNTFVLWTVSKVTQLRRWI